MKKFLKFLTGAVLLILYAIPAQALAGNITLQVKNKPLSEILKQIESQSGYSFLYNKQLVNVEQKQSIQVKEEALDKTLNTILAGKNIGYRISGKQIVLSPSDSKKTVSEDKLQEVTGIVIDGTTREPIMGASVIVLGTTRGVSTDLDGRFRLEAPMNSHIRISYLGYIAQEVVVKDKKELKIYLNEDTQKINEVVVVGYGAVSKKNLTTAISQVKPDDVQKAANSNVNQLLVGRAPGMQATISSAQPDGKVNISIRGAGNPIYVVDGVVMPSSAISLGSGSTGLPSGINRSGLAGLNPADIESVEVLKDASAAIYGIGASDGVILITTKKGKEGQPSITYDGSYSFVRNYPYLKSLDAQEYMNFANLFSKENYLYTKKQYPYGGLEFDGLWTPMFSDSDIANAQTTNWTDLVLKSGYITNHNLTISGGTKVVNYYLGSNYFEQEGNVTNSGMDKFAFRGNVGVNLFPFLKLTSVFNANRNNYKNSMVGTDIGNKGNIAGGSLNSALLYPSYLPVYQEDGSYTKYKNIPNPASMKHIKDNTRENGFNLVFTADLDLYKDMIKLRGIYGMNQENVRRSTFIPSTIYFDLMNKSRGNIHSERRFTQTMEAMVTFSKNFADIVQVDALAGLGKYLEDYEGYAVSYENVHDIINEHNIGSASGRITPNSYTGKNEKRSQFVKASADVLDRYVVSMTLRRDGTDKFFPENKYAVFPSVSAAWKVSNEPFLRDITWIGLLKLRASWGKTGQDNLGSSLYGLYAPNRFKVNFSDNSIVNIPYVLMGANYPDVSWQKTLMKNLGVDFYVLNNRISGSFDIYRNDVTRLLGTAPTSPLAIFESRPVNGAHFYRKGWEFMLETQNLTGAFTWNSVLTVSRVNAYWKKRMPNHDYQQYQKKEKEPVNAFYYYKVDGYINSERSNMPASQLSLQNEAQYPGCPIIKDKNGDGKIDVNDVYLRDMAPKAYIGFGNTFTYKNFDLDVFMYGQVGIIKFNQAYSAAVAGPLAGDYPTNSNVFAYRLWNSQNNPNGNRAGIAVHKMGALPGNAGTDADYENASFLRMRNITLGYNLQGSLLGPLQKYVKNIRVYCDVQNPFVITKYKGFDPEIYTGGGGASGESRGEYPQVRTFSLGAKLNF
ncbi:MAG: SusC/RagA family TonB-linked outer membrane protein [Bacteroidales bacterium]